MGEEAGQCQACQELGTAIIAFAGPNAHQWRLSRIVHDGHRFAAAGTSLARCTSPTKLEGPVFWTWPTDRP